MVPQRPQKHEEIAEPRVNSGCCEGRRWLHVILLLLHLPCFLDEKTEVQGQGKPCINHPHRHLPQIRHRNLEGSKPAWGISTTSTTYNTLPGFTPLNPPAWDRSLFSLENRSQGPRLGIINAYQTPRPNREGYASTAGAQ